MIDYLQRYWYVHHEKIKAIVATAAAIAALVFVVWVTASTSGCQSYWENRHEELLGQGYTAEQADAIIQHEQAEIVASAKAAKNAAIDAAPIPGPKEPIKELSDYWLQILLAAAGIGTAPFAIRRWKNSEKGKL